MLAEFDACFGPHQQKALQGLAIVPSILVDASDNSVTRLSQFAEMYQQDLPSPAPSTFQSELQCWKIKWQEQLKQHGKASLPTPLPKLTARDP